MTTRTVCIALACATVLAGSTACHTTTPSAPSQSSSATTSSTPAAVAPTSCTDLGGTVGSDQTCTVHTETPTYTIDMHFPADYPDQAAITNRLTLLRDNFVKTVEEPPVRDVPRALDIKGTSYGSSGTESLVFEEFVNVGGAHPETYYDSLNYDLGKQAPITFDALFKPGSDPVAVLDPIVKAELTKQLPGAPVDDNMLGAPMYRSFALTDDAVIFFIGQGMWTIEAAGAQQVSVPRSALAAILA